MSDPVAALFHTSGTNAPESVLSRARELAATYVTKGERLPFAPGDVVGPYEVLRVLGAGGQAVVYEARVYEGKHQALGRRVALKVPRKDLGDRLTREAKLVAELNHPSIVQVIDLSVESAVPYLVLELCEKGSLDERLEIVAPDGLPLDQVHAIATSILEALAFAHERGIVHRDVKPANVLFDAENRAKVSDFGIGTIARADELAVSVELSNLSQLAGTPLYVAPEQENPALRVNGRLDGRADLFAFGKLLFQMLTGASPRTIRPPSRLRPELGGRGDDYVFKLTEERPERRFATARQALEALPPTPAARAAESQKLQDDAIERAANEEKRRRRDDDDWARRRDTARRLGVPLDDAPKTPLADRLGPYKILSHELEPTGMIACDAFHELLGKRVTIRMLSEAASQSVKRRERFVAMTRAAARVQSPHVVPVIDQRVTPDGIPYVVVERSPGERLDAVLARKDAGGMPWKEALAIVRDVARGLDAIHVAGLLHGSVKPGYVLVGPDGARLDGLSRFAEVADEVRLAQDGQVLGAFLYRAPELGHVRDPDGRSDIYSLGVLFYEMVTDAAPHAGSTLLELLSRKAQTTVVPPEARGALLPLALRKILGKMLEPERAFRYRDAKHLLEDIAAFDQGAPVSAGDPSIWSPSRLDPTQPPPRRTPIGPLLLGMAILAGPLGVLAYVVQQAWPQGDSIPIAIGAVTAVSGLLTFGFIQLSRRRNPNRGP